MSYSYLDHTADIGIAAQNSTIPRTIYDAYIALLRLMYDDLTVVSNVTRKIVSRAESIEFCIVDFLNEVLRIMDTEEILFLERIDINFIKSKNEITIDADLPFVKRDTVHYKAHTEVKAVTYSGLQFKQHADGFYFQCLCDV